MADARPSLWWLPNAMTLARVALAPVVLVAYGAGFGVRAGEVGAPTGGQQVWLAVALGAFILAALLDAADGFFARRLNAESDLGRLLDPVADKALAAAAFCALLAWGSDGLWGPELAPPVFLILARDALVSGLRAHAGGRDAVVAPSYAAKVKTVLEFVALGVLLAAPLAIFQGFLGQTVAKGGLGLLWVAAGLAVWTGALYARDALKK